MVADAWGDSGQRISTVDIRFKAGRLKAFHSEQGEEVLS
jgi:hypothetical protein